MKDNTFLILAGVGVAAYFLSARAGTSPPLPSYSPEVMTLGAATTPITTRARGVSPAFADVKLSEAIGEGERLLSYQGASRALRENLAARPLSDFAESVAIGRQVSSERLSVSRISQLGAPYGRNSEGIAYSAGAAAINQQAAAARSSSSRSSSSKVTATAAKVVSTTSSAMKSAINAAWKKAGLSK